MINGLKTNIQLPSKNAIQSDLIGLSEIGIRSAVIKGLILQGNLQNVKIHNAQNSPYVVNKGVTPDSGTKFVSKLNTVVYSNVIFNGATVLDANFNTIDKFEDFRIDDCLITVNQAKKIITTEIQGRDGTIKEYIGQDDYQISIVGRINGAYGVNPKEDAKQLKKIFSFAQPLAISSWWLQNLDITTVVVKDYNFSQTEGEYSTQYFSVNLLSDKPTEARITGQ